MAVSQAVQAARAANDRDRKVMANGGHFKIDSSIFLLKRRQVMKKVISILAAVFILSSTLAFAGGDQNQNQHDGDKGQGTVSQERVNK